MTETNERPPRDWDLVRAAMELAIEANEGEVR